MITIIQNSEKQLQRLAAQRQMYASAKRWFGVQVLLSGPLAVLLAVFVSAFPHAKGGVALWGLLLWFADLFWLSPRQKHLRDAAARTQEAFDCDVLELPWNQIKAGDLPEPELIKQWADRYAPRAAKMPPLRDWYSPVVGELPLYVGRLLCQRANCWWDSTQRRRYAVSVISAVIVVFVTLLGIAFWSGLTIEDFVLKVVAPSMPAIQLGVRQFAEQMAAAKRLDRLKGHAEDAWNKVLSGLPDADATSVSRVLQDEILDSRRNSPLIFEFVFKMFRAQHEAQMNFGSQHFAQEAMQRLGFRGA